jgi:3-hydroxyacyl-CoA dehydrogenase / enoyl-CoA hydratase / 3-hydroxybutyryl-CoA epimerase
MMFSLKLEHVDGIAVVTLDLAGEPVNKVTMALRGEFSEMFGLLEGDPGIRGVVLASGKADSWIAGADIDEFLTLSSAAEAEALSRSGQALLERLAAMKLPVVAAIHGACLGGGLETALACRYRIVTDDPKTVLGLPEVQLGLLPGAGGTQRLPRLVGLQRALDLILTGRTVRARKAWQMGLADEIVHPAILHEVAVDRAKKLADKTLGARRSPKNRGAGNALLENNPIGRSIVFRKAREGVMEKTHGNFPAPLAALGAVQAGYERGRDAGYREEARAFGELAMSEESKQLVFLYFATAALKKDAGVDPPAPAPASVETLGVLGAGFMGAGIAAIAVQQGTPVRLKDTDTARVGKGIAAVSAVLRERLTKKQITRVQYEDQLLLAGGTTDYAGFHRATLVIEAVFEDLGLKQRVLGEVEPLLAPDAIYASNTSTIPIASIAAAARRPERVLGMHFFSPVHRMPLLEVIATRETDRDAVVTAAAYGKQLGKTVIVVNDSPGFYTTRVLATYLNEAGRLLDEGASIDAVDRALVAFGFPVGPITLIDEVGIDVGGKVGQVMAESFGTRMAPAESLRRVVESGRTGRKGRSGFYRYDQAGSKGEVDPTIYELMPHGPARREVAASEIQQRCVLAMVNEAAHCLEEGVLRAPRDGDIGAVFGIGFPPFRGGPFRYVDSEGAATIVARLEELDDRFPDRFTPASLLAELGRTHGRFYPAQGHPFP